MNSRVPSSTGRRIALDVGPARTPAAGVSVYVRELAKALDELAPERIAWLGMRSEGPLEGARDRGAVTRMTGRSYLAWLQGFADRDARRVGTDLVHFTNSVAPFRASIPFVVTIHDVTIIRRPRQHPIARLARIPFTILAARRARLVITPSEATADEARRLLHVPPSRIAVIPLAARVLQASQDDTAVLERLGLRSGPFILSLGTIEPRKNGIGLLAAFERVSRDHPTLRLVFTGDRGWRDGGFRRAYARSPVIDRVVMTGHLPDGEVAALLGACAAMVYPSFDEGFGLPVVEAMAAGAPVVTSGVASMSEVAAEAAILVDPKDVGSIAAGIAQAIARRDELGAAGRARAAGRTWLDVGRETLAAYDLALGRGA